MHDAETIRCRPVVVEPPQADLEGRMRAPELVEELGELLHLVPIVQSGDVVDRDAMDGGQGLGALAGEPGPGPVVLGPEKPSGNRLARESTRHHPRTTEPVVVPGGEDLGHRGACDVSGSDEVRLGAHPAAGADAARALALEDQRVLDPVGVGDVDGPGLA